MVEVIPIALRILGLVDEILLHLRRVEDGVDLRDIGEAVVDPEPDVRGELHVDAVGDLHAQQLALAFERLEHLSLVAAAERHDEGRGELQGRAHLDVGDRHDMAVENRIVDGAARQQVRQGVTDQLGDTEHAMGRLAALLVVVT